MGTQDTTSWTDMNIIPIRRRIFWKLIPKSHLPNDTHIFNPFVRMLRVRFFLMLLIILGLMWFLHTWSHLGANNSLNAIEISKKKAITELTCRHPDLDPFNPAISKFLSNVGELKCDTEENWMNLNKGLIEINNNILKKYKKITCKLKYMKRVDDFTVNYYKEVKFTSQNKAKELEDDFFSVNCVEPNNKKWSNIYAGTYRNQSTVERAENSPKPPRAMGLNVLIFGLDSMSKNHYRRKLPLTYKYLTEVLNATVLNGYNIVGDGTPQALIPILTGFAEPELPETRKRMPNANYVNVYPFVWKNFTANGYVTAYGEDSPSTGTFTYRLKGFNESPTDHYIRPFYLEVDKIINKHPKFCLGNTPRHKVMLDWLKHFFYAYSDVPKFAFGFHGELSHDDYNLVGYVDKELHVFLQDLRNEGILNSTLLMVMSDHGHRFASIRETQQGKQEERLPFFSIVVPPWLETKYPKLVQNLRSNSDKLTNPFDIYPTLLTVLDTNIPNEGNINSRGISLFSKIPDQRTCTHASIEPHWCACLSWEEIPETEPIAMEAAQAVVDFINNYTKSQSTLCSRLVLDKVAQAQKLSPNEALLKFKKNADTDGFVGDFTDDTHVSEVIYQVQFATFPSNALYEASAKFNTLKKTFHVREKEISRINVYGNQPHCVYYSNPELRKYCYCKVQL